MTPTLLDLALKAGFSDPIEGWMGEAYEERLEAFAKLIIEHEAEKSSDQAEYERGFIDGMQKQMQSSVDKAVNAMARKSADTPVAWMDADDNLFYTEEDAYKTGIHPIQPLMKGSKPNDVQRYEPGSFKWNTPADEPAFWYYTLVVEGQVVNERFTTVNWDTKFEPFGRHGVDHGGDVTKQPLYTRPQPAARSGELTPQIKSAYQHGFKAGLETAQMRMPKVGDRVICIEDESLATVESLTGGGSPDIKFDDGSRGTYLLREFAELFRYADTQPAAWVGLTDEEMRELEKQFEAERVRTSDDEYLVIYPAAYWQWQRAIEAKLREKNA